MVSLAVHESAHREWFYLAICSSLAGTIFENTNKPLRDWFKVTHLMLTSKKGMSSRFRFGRYDGLWSGYKTAWPAALG